MNYLLIIAIFIIIGLAIALFTVLYFPKQFNHFFPSENPSNQTTTTTTTSYWTEEPCTVENERRCNGNGIVECINGRWAAYTNFCQYGCSNGVCNESPTTTTTTTQVTLFPTPTQTTSVTPPPVPT